MATANGGATANGRELRQRQRQPERWGRNLILLVLVVVVALTAWFWSTMRTTAVARSAYAAQAACLCHFAAGRGLQSCQGDPAVRQTWVGLHVDEAAHSLTASVPALASQTARWSPQNGCMLDPWKD